jgi:2-oxo-4-hydroxy-4-carboxy--5-ureidoimidazoline (OHCU) decarboxylase
MAAEEAKKAFSKTWEEVAVRMEEHAWTAEFASEAREAAEAEECRQRLLATVREATLKAEEARLSHRQRLLTETSSGCERRKSNLLAEV